MLTSVSWFADLRLKDVPSVGGKNASLGELYSALSAEGVRIPDGFALTATAYRDALGEAGAWEELRRLLSDFDHRDVALLAERAAAARRIVYDAAGGMWLREEIARSYRALEQKYGADVAVAVRSSSTAEDLPTASFAGQHDSFLNVRGETDLIEARGHCFASIFTDRAIVYRIDNCFDHFKVALSVGVMKMVRADLAASGASSSPSTPNRAFGMSFSSLARGGSARISCRARSIPTSSMCTSRPSGRDTVRF
jgi:pyruvate, water dikinase